VPAAVSLLGSHRSSAYTPPLLMHPTHNPQAKSNVDAAFESVYEMVPLDVPDIATIHKLQEYTGAGPLVGGLRACATVVQQRLLDCRTAPIPSNSL